MIQIALLNLALLFSASVRLPSDGYVFFQTAENSTPVDYEIAAGLEAGKTKNLTAWTWFEREDGLQYTGLDLAGRYRLGWPEWSGFFSHKQDRGILRGGISTSLPIKCFRVGASQVWDHMDPATTADFGVQASVFEAGLRIYRRDGPEVESGFASIVAPLMRLKMASVDFSLKYGFDRNRREYMQAKTTIRIHNAEETANDG